MGFGRAGILAATPKFAQASPIPPPVFGTTIIYKEAERKLKGDIHRFENFSDNLRSAPSWASSKIE
jgi:hypothetical protein